MTKILKEYNPLYSQQTLSKFLLFLCISMPPPVASPNMIVADNGPTNEAGEQHRGAFKRGRTRIPCPHLHKPAICIIQNLWRDKGEHVWLALRTTVIACSMYVPAGDPNPQSLHTTRFEGYSTARTNTKKPFGP